MPIPKLRQWLGIELIEVSITEKAVSAFGGGLAILALIAISTYALPAGGAAALITSMGASAVLLFGVPHGQLSQPWPVIAGHGVSALIGVTCALCIPHPAIAAACAVGLAIGAMQQLKCIHPPGGATASTACEATHCKQHATAAITAFAGPCQHVRNCTAAARSTERPS